MTFIFRNRTIFWDISKWNRGQKKWDGGSIIFAIFGGWGGGPQKGCAFYLMMAIDPYLLDTFFCKDIISITIYLYLNLYLRIYARSVKVKLESILYPNECLFSNN